MCVHARSSSGFESRQYSTFNCPLASTQPCTAAMAAVGQSESPQQQLSIAVAPLAAAGCMTERPQEQGFGMLQQSVPACLPHTLTKMLCQHHRQEILPNSSNHGSSAWDSRQGMTPQMNTQLVVSSLVGYVMGSHCRVSALGKRLSPCDTTQREWMGRCTRATRDSCTLCCTEPQTGRPLCWH